MRLYVPSTLHELRVLAGDRTLAAPMAAFAVTPAFAAWVGTDGPVDDEELEFAALAEAARGSLRLLAEHGGPAVRAVLAVDVAPADLMILDAADDAAPGSVRIDRALAVSDLVSFHLDDPDAAGVVRAAASAVGAADEEDAAAEKLVETSADLALSWYLPAELDAVLVGRG